MTLAGLLYQEDRSFAVSVADLSDDSVSASAEVAAVAYLDDDLILEPFVLRLLVDDVRPEEQAIEFWAGPLRPERVRPRSREWGRHQRHSAANLIHVQAALGVTPARPQRCKLAWASACVLSDRKKHFSDGGFAFWRSVPSAHCGEDVAAQVRVLEKFGGCGVLPCGVFHQELGTTLPDPRFKILEVLEIGEGVTSRPGPDSVAWPADPLPPGGAQGLLGGALNIGRGRPGARV